MNPWLECDKSLFIVNESVNWRKRAVSPASADVESLTPQREAEPWVSTLLSTLMLSAFSADMKYSYTECVLDFKEASN